MVQKMQERWSEQLRIRQRRMLMKLFDRVELGDDADGLSFEEFQQFKRALPSAYQVRMAQLGSWQQIAGEDGELQFREFQDLIDRFVDEVAHDIEDRAMR